MDLIETVMNDLDQWILIWRQSIIKSSRFLGVPVYIHHTCSEGFLLARMSDVIHHPTRYHDNTSAHDIPTSNIIIRRKSIIPSDITIQNPYLLHMFKHGGDDT